MPTIQELKKEIQEIKERNRKVERDKSWETSWTRKFLIAILTYLVITLFIYIAGISKPFINSIVPTIAFIISTLILPIFKRVWIKRVYKK